MDEHKYIWLQPECCADPDEGRHWCQDPGPVECDDGKPWVKYILASEAETSLSELSARYLEQTERADGLARELEQERVEHRENAAYAVQEIKSLRAQLQAVTVEAHRFHGLARALCSHDNGWTEDTPGGNKCCNICGGIIQPPTQEGGGCG